MYRLDLKEFVFGMGSVTSIIESVPMERVVLCDI
jgi:hypothetical protein